MPLYNNSDPGTQWENLPSDSLVEECIRGRQAAWNEFLRRFGPLILGTIIRKLASIGHADAKTDADDIFQNVFKNLIEHNCRALCSIRNRNRIESWLCATAVHKTIDFARRKGLGTDRGCALKFYEGSRVSESKATYSSSEAEEAELVGEVREAVRALRPDEQLLIKWHYVHGLKYKEIAELADIPINTVSSRLFRIKKKLSKRLKKLEI